MCVDISWRNLLVMELVIKFINSIVAKPLYQSQFKEFLIEAKSEYADLLMHNNVRGLSRGNVLKRHAFAATDYKERHDYVGKILYQD